MPGLKILVCRLSHIGDCVLTLPMVNELRRAFPDARIAWAMESPSHKLLGNHPAIDECLVVSRGWMRRFSSARRLFRELRARRFDITVDPQSLLKSALVARLTGARMRLGFSGPHGREKSAWLNNVRVRPGSTHLVDRSLELIRPLVPDASFRGFGLQLPGESIRVAAAYLSQAGAENRAVILNPGASWPSKQWDNCRFAAVAVRLAREANVVPIVTWAGDRESAMADEIVAMSGGVAKKAPPTSLPGLASLLSLSRLFIGCDTGPLHIAAATGTRCLGLYGPTLPGDSGAYGDPHIAIQVRHQPGGNRERRRASNDAMREITVDMVADQALQALQEAIAKAA